MTAHDERDVETVAEALIEAAARAHFDHSHRGSRGIDGEDLTWADEVDAPYGKGAYRAMMRPVVAAVLDALDLPGRERRAYESGVQRGRRHVPGPHIPIPQPDYTTLLNERRESDE
jgi:hypothetical protein